MAMPQAAKRTDKRPGHERLAAWLDANGLSIRKFAAQCDVSKSYIGMLKNGDATPGLELAVAIERLTDGAVPCVSWHPETE